MTSNLAVPEHRTTHSFVRLCKQAEPALQVQLEPAAGGEHEDAAQQPAAISGEGGEASGLEEPDSAGATLRGSSGQVIQLVQPLPRLPYGMQLAGWLSVPPANARRPRPRAPSFDARTALAYMPSHDSVPEAVRGLCYRKGQTFGIELELAPRCGPIPAEDSAEWRRVANIIASALEHALPDGCFGGVYAEYLGSERGGKSPAHWNVEYDDTTGWEVTTRVLADAEGFCELVQGCHALAKVARELDLVADVRTGTHVHFGFAAGIDVLKQALGLTRLFEPALGSLVAPSRIAHLHDGRYDVSAPNPYCRPVSTVIDAQALQRMALFSDVTRLTRGEDELRYVTFNLRPLDHQQTVEVRLHHGTLDPHQILLWVSLWQQILWAAEHPQRPLPSVADQRVIDPTSDLLALAREHLPSSDHAEQRTFLAKLQRRRSQVVERHWKRAPELASWVRASCAWG